MSRKLIMCFFLAVAAGGCASQEYDVYGKSDARERIALSIINEKPGRSAQQLYYTELNDDLEFRFKRKLDGDNNHVKARFWIMDRKTDAMTISLEPGRKMKLDIDVTHDRLKIEREDHDIDKDKDRDD